MKECNHRVGDLDTSPYRDYVRMSEIPLRKELRYVEFTRFKFCPDCGEPIPAFPKEWSELIDAPIVVKEIGS